jgi:hypothetical protein
VHFGGVRLVYDWIEGALLHHTPLMLLLYLLGDQVQFQLLLLLSLLHPIVEAQPGTRGSSLFLLYLQLSRRYVYQQDSGTLVYL